jgi:hypothetical protein
MVQPKLDLLVRERRKQRGHIVFTKPITKDDDPVNFSWFYDSVNTYAMSEQQYPLMYPDSPNTNVEFIQLVPSIPVEEASIIINFPAGFTIEGKPWLSVLNADGTSVNRLETLYKSALLFDEKQNLISVRLPYAPLGLRYRVQWRLASTPPPSAGAFVQSLEGQANKTSSRLLQLARHRASNPLSDLLKGLADVACKEFNLADDEALVMNIMVFDPASKKFVVVAANFPADDERWDVKLDYGDGIAGRTYKMNRVTLFKKPAALKNKTPFYYVPAGGEAVEADGSNVPVEVLLSLPLWHPKQPGSIFGVLNIESRDPSSKLLDIQDDNVTTKFRQAVSKACFEAVNDLFLKP